MKNFKIQYAFFIIVLATSILGNAQTITEKKGYSPQIGATVSMLEDLKSRVTRSVQNLDQDEVDYLLDDQANRIGAMILHLAATEKYYQVYTFESRSFNEKESKIWSLPMELGDKGREKIKNKPIDYYLEIWDEVRAKTLELLKTKDDTWFSSKVNNGNMNNHWVWYHVMEHQANHMGQIRLIIKRIPN